MGKPYDSVDEIAARFAEIALASVMRDRLAREKHESAARAAVAAMVERLRSEPGVRRVVLFGSLAGGEVHERSDIDLAVEGLAREREAAVAAALALMTSIHVDLVRFEDASPELRTRIEQSGEVLLDTP
jgi:predicted nucleotidyltransferase